MKLYTTKLTYSELQTLAMDIRRGNANHDDNVIAEWIKVKPPDVILETGVNPEIPADDDPVGEGAE